MHIDSIAHLRTTLSHEILSVGVTVEIAREVAEQTFTKAAVVGQPKAKTQPAEVDVRVKCPPEIVRALRPEQIVPRVQVPQCDVVVTPPTVIVRW